MVRWMWALGAVACKDPEPGDPASSGPQRTGDTAAETGAETGTDTGEAPTLGSSQIGVGVAQDRAWIQQHGSPGLDDAWTVGVGPEGTFVGGMTTGSWYAPFLDPCLDTAHGAPFDCGDAVLFEAGSRVGIQLGDLASDEVRALSVSAGLVTFAGRSREPTGEQRLGAYVTRYTTDLLTEVYDTRMPRAELMGLAMYGDQPYVAGGTLHHWEPDEDNLGDEDALTMRLRSDGSIETVQQSGTPAFEELLDVVVDDDGVYLSGFTTGYLGADGGLDAAAEDGVLLMWSHTLADADQLCSVQLGTSGRDATEGIAVFGDHVYVAGNAEGAINQELADGAECWHEGADALPDAFLAKYDKLCQHVWTRQFGTDLGDAAEALAVDEDHVYVVGYANAGTDHGDEPREPTTDGFLRAYTHDGELVGEVVFDSSASVDDRRVDYARGLLVDETFVYVVGATDGEMGLQPNAGDRDIFLAVISKAEVIGNVAFTGSGCP